MLIINKCKNMLTNLISIPLFDHLIMEMKEIFNKDILYISFGALLIP